MPTEHSSEGRARTPGLWRGAAQAQGDPGLCLPQLSALSVACWAQISGALPASHGRKGSLKKPADSGQD